MGLEIVATLLALKLRHPDHVYLLRGNHECSEITVGRRAHRRAAGAGRHGRHSVPGPPRAGRQEQGGQHHARALRGCTCRLGLPARPPSPACAACPERLPHWPPQVMFGFCGECQRRSTLAAWEAVMQASERGACGAARCNGMQGQQAWRALPEWGGPRDTARCLASCGAALSQPCGRAPCTHGACAGV